MTESLRIDGESDADFRARAERAAGIAKVLVAACLRNAWVQHLIESPDFPLWTVDSVLRNPTVRVEFEQALAIGSIGECLAAAAGKSWGEGPWILPLEEDDWFYPSRVTYRFKENSLYNRRFEQRRRMKKLLGKTHRPLVEEAKGRTKGDFLRLLTAEQAKTIRRVFSVEPGEFWQAAKGKAFLNLPPEMVQGELDFGD